MPRMDSCSSAARILRKLGLEKILRMTGASPIPLPGYDAKRAGEDTGRRCTEKVGKQTGEAGGVRTG